MRNDAERLCNAIGQDITSVAAEVLFYGVEPEGYLNAVLVDFADSSQFVMGCAGDGSVSVTRFRGNKGCAPGFFAEWRTVGDLGGQLKLRGVSILPHALRLQIGQHEMLLINDDDELAFTVNGKALSPQIFRR